MHRLPCAIHPANHALVQELSLVAALLKEQRAIPGSPHHCPTGTQAPHGGDQNEIFLRAASAIARCPVALEETLAYPKGYGIGKIWRSIDLPAERWVRSRLRAQERGQQELWKRMKAWEKEKNNGIEHEDARPSDLSSHVLPPPPLSFTPQEGAGEVNIPFSVSRNARNPNGMAGELVRFQERDSVSPPSRSSSSPSSFSSSPSPCCQFLSSQEAIRRFMTLLFHSPFSPSGASSSSPPSLSSLTSSSTCPPLPSSPIGRLLQHVFPFLRYTPPFRLIAQHGPCLFLQRHVPYYLRDTLTYEEACRHRAWLQGYLGPLGFQVEMTGAFRRGAPQGPMVSFVIAFTPERVTALCEDIQDVQGETLWKVPPCGDEEKESEEQHKKGKSKTNGEEQGSSRGGGGALVARLCAASPAAEPLLRHPIERALDGLARCGYIVAGKRLTLTNPSIVKARSGAFGGGGDVGGGSAGPVSGRPSATVTTREASSTTPGLMTGMVEVVTRMWCEEYYAQHVAEEKSKMAPCRVDGKKEEEDAYMEWNREDGEERMETISKAPTPKVGLHPPPRNITDPADALAVHLHTVRLYFVPVNLFFLQLFFLTGPSSFTAHVTMRALERGKRLYDYGLFQAVPPPLPTSSPSPSSSLFPINCSGAGGMVGGDGVPSPSSPNTKESSSTSTSIPITSEEVIFDAAGLTATVSSSSDSRFIHPFLRGIYCQLQNH